MAKKRTIRNRGKMCDPGLCDHCIYIGDGDFLCDKFEEKDGEPTVIMTSWEPTENYMRCKQGGDSHAVQEAH